jgi:cyclohexanecarboxylate-CoA ligase
VEAAKAKPETLHTLKVFVAAGAPIPRHLVGQAKELFDVNVCSMWGMSENGGVTFTRPGDPPSKTLETDGYPADGMELQIVDDANKKLPVGSEGRLMVRGAGMFVGYLKRPELSVTDKDGWFDTGDLARMDADGYIRIIGRSKDVIIRGGYNIYASDVEAVLYSHPDVQEAAVVGKPHQVLGEDIAAYVVLKDGASVTPDELIAHAKDHLADYKVPRSVEIRDDLPRNATGKVLKRALVEELTAG